jgi:hypothetical protein
MVSVCVDRWRFPFSMIHSPVHAIHAHSDSVIFLATSNLLHKYNPTTRRIEQTHSCPTDSHVSSLASADDWLFITGGDKRLRVLNVVTLEPVGEW